MRELFIGLSAKQLIDFTFLRVQYTLSVVGVVQQSVQPAEISTARIDSRNVGESGTCDSAHGCLDLGIRRHIDNLAGLD